MQQEQAAQREQLRDKLNALRRDIAAAEATRSEAADALATSERSISDANRKLRDLNQQQGVVKAQLDDIAKRRASTQTSIAAQQAQLGQMLHEQYLAGTQDPYKLLFSGDDPNRIQRDLHYLGYLSRAQADVLRGLRGNLDQLADLGRQTEARNADLGGIARDQEAERAKLVAEQAARRDTLDKISEKLKSQRAEAGALERDEQRLSRVVEELAKVIERQARETRERERERERQRQRDAQAEAARAAKKPESRPDAIDDVPDRAPEKRAPGPRNELVPESGFSGNFAALRGRLRLPLKGELAARYGAGRPDGGPSWKGLFIRAQTGAEVRAVAPGRVVFAEWLRGFGNLLIVDHGNQYLSIYGNNESLLKQPGDVVQSGDVIATVGNSGGNPETGLYFELRYQGKPFDPLAWASLR